LFLRRYAGSAIDAKVIQRPLPGNWPHDGSWPVAGINAIRMSGR
jgi:hypothetical protein